MADTAVDAWRLELAPWTTWLFERLAVSVDTLASRDDLHRRLWIDFHPPDEPVTDREWLVWLEGLKLFDLLEQVDSRVCWSLVLTIAGARTHLEQQGCPEELFTGIRPRYQINFPRSTVPPDGVVDYLASGECPVDYSDGFYQVKRKLQALASPLRATSYAGRIQIRFHFSLMGSTRVYYGSKWGKTQTYFIRRRVCFATLACLRKIRNIATRIVSPHSSRTSPFAVKSLGIESFHVCVSDDALELLRQIASKIALFHFSLRVQIVRQGKKLLDIPDYGNFYGPFLWTMLPPVSSVATSLGVQSLWIITPSQFREGDIAALCSALTQNQSLRSFDMAVSKSTQWISWLAYALFSKHAAHRIHEVKLHLPTLTVGMIAVIQRLLEHEDPVTSLAALDDGVEEPRSPTEATLVRVDANTTIVPGYQTKLCGVTNLSHFNGDHEYPMVSRNYGEHVRILVPGIGFCCVDRNSVQSTRPVPTVSRIHAVRTLSIVLQIDKDTAPNLAALLRLVGGPLRELTLQGTSCGQRLDGAILDEVGLACPDLKRLRLAVMTLCTHSLLTAKWPRRLQSLSLDRCNVDFNSDESTTDRWQSMLPRLNALHVASNTQNHHEEFHEMVLALGGNGPARRLVLKTRDERLIEHFRPLVEEHHAESMPAIGLHEKLAFLSVVLPTAASDTQRPPYHLSVDIVALVLQMAAKPLRRRTVTVVD